METLAFRWFTLLYALLGLLMIAGGLRLLAGRESAAARLLKLAEIDTPPSSWVGLTRILFFLTLPSLFFAWVAGSWVELLFSVWCLAIVFLAARLLLHWKGAAEAILKYRDSLHGKISFIAANLISLGFILLLLLFHLHSGKQGFDREPYDLVITSGVVYDGSGTEGRTADVAIRGDRIVRVGRVSRSERRAAGRVIDAGGLAVSPGFINMLSWGAEPLINDGRSMSGIKQGVTLELFGEGWSMGPLNREMRTERWGEDPDGHLWRTLGEFLTWLEKRGVSANIGSFVGATTVRIHELGYRDRAPEPDELQRMRELVAEAMREGAMGLGSSLIYAPAFYADTEELIELAGVAGGYGGIYTSHIRSEGNRLLESVEELIRIGREAGIHAEIHHLKAAGRENWHKLDNVIERVERARETGQQVTANMYTYSAAATSLAAIFPPQSQEGGHDEWIARLRDPQQRSAIARRMNTPSDEWENFYLMAGGGEGIILTGFRTSGLQRYVGMTLAEVTAARGGSDEIETAIDLTIEDNSRIGAIYHLMSEENVRRQIALPWMSFGSDGGTFAAEGEVLERMMHPRAWGNFARLLGKYVREEGIIPLHEAIHRLTGLPAENLGLTGRGLLAEGYLADVVVFDPERIRDRATFEQPHRYAEGVVHVWVNGVQVLDTGEHTGEMPGRFVRGAGADPVRSP